jgi:hypothetical protein
MPSLRRRFLTWGLELGGGMGLSFPFGSGSAAEAAGFDRQRPVANVSQNSAG